MAKKLKREESAVSFFSNFLKDKNNEDLLVQLRTHLYQLARSSELSMSFLRVVDANPKKYVEFSRARCDVTNIMHEERKRFAVLPIGCFFETGYDILENFLDKHLPMVPEDVMRRKALFDLLHFLTCYKKGCAKGWHGMADIVIMDKVLPVNVKVMQEETDEIPETQDENNNTSKHSESSFRSKKMFLSQVNKQMIAQTIVFSFLKGRENAYLIEHRLVPGIGICAGKLIVHMYDCEEDVLVETIAMNLFLNEGENQVMSLNIRAVLVLWLVLNYRLFCTGIPDDAKHFKADFHKILGPEYLKVYKNEVVQPINLKVKEKIEHDPTSQLVAPYRIMEKTRMPTVDFIPVE